MDLAFKISKLAFGAGNRKFLEVAFILDGNNVEENAFNAYSHVKYIQGPVRTLVERTGPQD